MTTGYDLLIDHIDGRLHAAVTCKNGLFDLYADGADNTARWGAVYLGKIVKIDRKLKAAVVSLGDIDGLLPLTEAHKPGDMIPVIVKAEGRQAADLDAHKLPRLAPAADGTVITGGDVGLRIPAPDALLRALGDYGAEAFDHIHVADKPLLNRLIDWSALHAPALAQSKRLRLFRPERPGQRLFDQDDIFGALENLGASMLPLPGGGDVIFDQTHAALVVDVNQGSAATIPCVNRAAAEEITKQLRLRNISGVVLVDFINMPKKDDRTALLEHLQKLADADKAGLQIHGFTRLGILEMTRKRRDGAYAEKLSSF